MRALAVAFLLITGCKGHSTKEAPAEAKVAPPRVEAVVGETKTPSVDDPMLEKDQDEYVADIMAFTEQTKDQVRDRMKKGSVPLKEEWEAWEKQGPMTEARMAEFYKQTTNYIYELGEWHLFVADKRASDVQLVENLKRMGVKNVLDFGGGVGLNALLIARAGIDVTLADLDSTSLRFAEFRAKRHGVPLKIWKTDVEPMPPDAKYDAILALDVLEHLPRDVLKTSVDKLVKLKTDKTRIILSAPFGRTAVHPMHLDADEHTKEQVKRLQTELPSN